MNSSSFQKVFRASGIDYDEYIRTTEERHKESVLNFWSVLNTNKAISLGSHTGFYSTNDETFVMEKDLIKDGDQFKT